MVVCKVVVISSFLDVFVVLYIFSEIILGFGLEEVLFFVRDVRWDVEGMIWEVYGVAVDFEVLGVVI